MIAIHLGGVLDQSTWLRSGQTEGPVAQTMSDHQTNWVVQDTK